MYRSPDATRSAPDSSNGATPPIAQLAAALVELAEAQRATDQRLAQLVNINQWMANTQQQQAEQSAAMEGVARLVAVKNINMSFGAMVVFMVKWAIAAIPAAIVLFWLGLVASMLFGGMLMSLAR